MKECEEILHKIDTHPLAAMVSGAKKLLFGNELTEKSTELMEEHRLVCL